MTRVELIDELTGHKNAVCCITIANDHLYTGSYDMTVRSWSIDDIHGRLMMRRRMLMEEDYSIKAEAYKCVLDAKKKKRNDKSKSRGKGTKPKSSAPAIKPKPAIQPSPAVQQEKPAVSKQQIVEAPEPVIEEAPPAKSKVSKGKSISRPTKK